MALENMYLILGSKTLKFLPIINIAIKPIKVIMDYLVLVPLGIDQLWSDIISVFRIFS